VAKHGNFHWRKCLLRCIFKLFFAIFSCLISNSTKAIKLHSHRNLKLLVVLKMVISCTFRSVSIVSYTLAEIPAGNNWGNFPFSKQNTTRCSEIGNFLYRNEFHMCIILYYVRINYDILLKIVDVWCQFKLQPIS
jgi:hypothetical protein